MSILIKFLVVGWLACLPQLVLAAMPDLKLPFEPGRSWTLTRGYLSQTPPGEETTHVGKDHYALDFALGTCDDTYGKTILAAASGTVKSIKRVEKQTPDPKLGYGNSIVIDHGDGWSTRYAHLSTIDSSVAEEGKPVAQGQKIGEAGGTGWVEGASLCSNPPGVKAVHLHFALYRNGEGVKPEPMSGYTDFTRLRYYISNNTLRGPAATEPAISCVYVSSSRQFCWRSDNATPSLCTKAKSWVLYDYNVQVAYNKSVGDCPNYCVASNNYCKEVSGSLSVGGFGSGPFNLKIDFDIMDPVTGNERQAGMHQLRPGQVLSLEVEVGSVNGDVRNYFRPGKDSLKVDYYYRVDEGDWVFYRRDTVQGYNLGAGKKLEKESFTVPFGARELSFKAKIDALDDVSESNEGDNWSRIETFRVYNPAALQTIIQLLLND